MEAPQNRRFYGTMECLTLWPTYIGEKWGLWAKHIGLKPGDIENILEEHIENLANMSGTWWEPIGNLKGTGWEQRKNEKVVSPAPPGPPFSKSTDPASTYKKQGGGCVGSCGLDLGLRGSSCCCCCGIFCVTAATPDTTLNQCIVHIQVAPQLIQDLYLLKTTNCGRGASRVASRLIKKELLWQSNSWRAHDAWRNYPSRIGVFWKQSSSSNSRGCHLPSC